MIDIDHESSSFRFSVPSGSTKIRILASFNGEVSDKEFIFTVKPVSKNLDFDKRIQALSWSNSLDSSFEYVAPLAHGEMYYGRSFSINQDIESLDVSVVEWKRSPQHAGAALESLALELESETWGFPDPLNRVILPGRPI